MKLYFSLCLVIVIKNNTVYIPVVDSWEYDNDPSCS